MGQLPMHVILLGNEKGGSGKSTTAMHVSAGLMQMGYDVGALDLDLRQRSFTRYLENRSQWAEANNRPLPMPRLVPIAKATAETIEAAAAEEAERLDDALQTLSSCDFVVIDSPGSDTSLSRLGHAKADTIITPMNDSFVDFDLLARIDPDSQKVLGPSLYSEMVWEARKRRAIKTSRSIDWIVMRNRLTSLDAKNKRRVADR
ncbi:MAG: division plane positioning ATPase MipZ, partial [Pseudomonadota bacterium]